MDSSGEGRALERSAEDNAWLDGSNARWAARWVRPEAAAPAGAPGTAERAAYDRGRADERALLLPILVRMGDEMNVGKQTISCLDFRKGTYATFWGNNMQATGPLGACIDYAASPASESYRDRVLDLTKERG